MAASTRRILVVVDASLYEMLKAISCMFGLLAGRAVLHREGIP